MKPNLTIEQKKIGEMICFILIYQHNKREIIQSWLKSQLSEEDYNSESCYYDSKGGVYDYDIQVDKRYLCDNEIEFDFNKIKPKYFYFALERCINMPIAYIRRYQVYSAYKFLYSKINSYVAKYSIRLILVESNRVYTNHKKHESRLIKSTEILDPHLIKYIAKLAA